MSTLALHVENLSKRYYIGGRLDSYRTLRDALSDAVISPFRKAAKLLRGHATGAASLDEEIWALTDISFDVKHGEVIGIIGRNGAGKSTLLKILSRISEPTSGFAEIHGRVGSLLEVGTGFHPELTGRENIYLNGAILGMKRSEIEHKFDEIVAFAEVEKFIDTPVKHYSSGMYLRLAFAVAAHLEPEILIVDEVLAVGDAAFQKKCLGKMDEVAKEGRTVLFVSHNMAAILTLCEKAVLLDSGRVIANETTQEVVDQYLRIVNSLTDIPLAERLDRRGNQDLKFLAFELRDRDGLPIQNAYSGQNVGIALKYRSHADEILKTVHIAIGIHGRFDEKLFHLSTTVNGFEFDEIPASGTIVCNIPCLPLQPGRYSFNLFSTVGGEMADWIPNAGAIEVEAGDFFRSGKLPPPDQGSFMVRHSWSIAAA